MVDKDYDIPEPEPTDEDIEAIADEAADEARAEMAAKGEQEEGEFEQEKREAEEAGIIVDGKVVDEEVPIAEDDAGASQEELEAELDDMRKGMEDRHVALVGKEGTWPSDHGEPLIADLVENPLYRTEPTLPLAPPGTEAADVAQLIHRVSVLESLLAGGAEQEYLLPEGLQNFFFARITSSAHQNGDGTADSADPSTKWTYGWSEAYKSAAGYGGWTVDPNGRSGTTAFNYIEDINTDTGGDRMGNGVILENLDYDGDDVYEFAPRPVPVNVIVQMRVVEFAVSNVPTVEYWFAYENGTDGVCD